MTDLEHASRLRAADDLAFVVVRRGEVLASGAQNGVVELLAAVDRLGDAARGASLADKVTGKAVAVIAVAAGFTAIGTPIASEAAIQFCAQHRVFLRASTIVATILNRRGDDPCPMETLTRPCADAAEGLVALRTFLAARPARMPQQG